MIRMWDVASCLERVGGVQATLKRLVVGLFIYLKNNIRLERMNDCVPCKRFEICGKTCKHM